MKLKTVILLKNREVLVKDLNRKHTHVEFQKGLYVVSEPDISTVRKDRKIKGSEIIFFEGNPNALNVNTPQEEKSGSYLNELVIANALSQTSGGPRYDVGSLIDRLSWLGKPVNWVYLIFAGAIAWGLLAGWLGWV